MNHAYGWMVAGWAGGMWIYTVIGVLPVILLVVVIVKLSNNNREFATRL
jgi:chromate transport protein ChrA